jgi:leucyl-tRNA synthetase
MHVDLAIEYIRVQALLMAPIAPHVAEHLYSTVLGESISIQQAQYPTITQPVDEQVIESATYLRTVVKTIRDTEASHLRKKKKGKFAAAFDPAKKTSVRVITSTGFPAWQKQCIEIVKQCWNVKTGLVDDGMIKELMGKAGLGKEKKAMPFIANLKVSCPSIHCSALFSHAPSTV